MKGYMAFWLSGLVVFAGIWGVLLIHGGWEAVAAAVTIAAGLVFLGSTIALGAARDRLVS